MRELNQRQLELEITQNEWFSTWMLCRVKKRKRMDVFEYTELRQEEKMSFRTLRKNTGSSRLKEAGKGLPRQTM